MCFDRLNIIIEYQLKTPTLSMRFVVIYRLPLSAKNGLTTAIFMFFEEWGRFIDKHTIKPGPLIIVGDLNFQLDKATNVDAKRLINCVNATGFRPPSVGYSDHY